MALKFQPPNIERTESREEALLKPIGNAVQTLPALYAQYKLQRMQQNMALKEQEMKLKEFESKYGTGIAQNIQPGQMVAPPPVGGEEEQVFGGEVTPPTFTEETPEQRMRRVGTEVFGKETERIKAEQEKPSRLQLKVTDKNVSVLFNPTDGTTIVQSTGEPYDASVHGSIRLPGDPNQSNEGIRREGLVNIGLQALGEIRASVSPQVLRDLKIIRNDPTGGFEQISATDSKNALNNLRTAIENQLYLKTGATATEDETRNAMKKFLAAVGDNPGDFEARLKILERDLRGFTRNTPSSNSVSQGSNTPVLPKAGDIKRGYRFKGGDPADKGSWEKI